MENQNEVLINIKGPTFLEAGYVLCPWVNIPYRGKWFNIIDNIILRIPILSKFYLKWLTKQPGIITTDGNSRVFNIYSKKIVNNSYYKTLWIKNT
jgi:hypothetical protein